MGFQHFMDQADGVALSILVILLVMSVGTWYYIVTKGWRYWGAQNRSRDFIRGFWAAPSLEAVARKLRSTGITDPFSHLVHHGFTAVEQHQSRQHNSLVEAGDRSGQGQAGRGADLSGHGRVECAVRGLVRHGMGYLSRPHGHQPQRSGRTGSGCGSCR